jgi:hypothetical protein
MVIEGHAVDAASRGKVGYGDLVEGFFFDQRAKRGQKCFFG